jgi:hypothetical protein
MLLRTPTSFIGPCLPSSAEGPPSGPEWVHEIKHDGYRLMARRDPIGIRLLTRNGHDWSPRYPLIVEAVSWLKARSCLVDGEAVACDDNGVAVFQRLRRKPSGKHVLLVYPSTCSNSTARTYGGSHSRHARRLLPACYTDAYRACASTSTCRILATWCSAMPARWASKGSCRSGSARATSQGFSEVIMPSVR